MRHLKISSRDVTALFGDEFAKEYEEDQELYGKIPQSVIVNFYFFPSKAGHHTFTYDYSSPINDMGHSHVVRKFIQLLNGRIENYTGDLTTEYVTELLSEFGSPFSVEEEITATVIGKKQVTERSVRANLKVSLDKIKEYRQEWDKS